MSWLPESFTAPARADLHGDHHLRQMRPSDIDLDYPAVMGSRSRLWEVFGRAWGWPPATMTREQDLADLQRHADEMRVNASFNYAIFDEGETALLGCVYVDPPEKAGAGADAEISWWVVDAALGSALDIALLEQVPAWIETAWPFHTPRFIGVDLSWDAYLALPDRE